MVTQQRLKEISNGSTCKNKEELIASLKYLLYEDGDSPFDNNGNAELELHSSEWNLILDALKAY